MGETWPLVRLGEKADILTGFPFPGQHFTHSGGDVRLLRGDNVGQRFVRWDDHVTWPKAEIEKGREYLLIPSDVILAMDRPWIEAGLKFARISHADVPSLLVQRVARLRAREHMDQRFLYFVMSDPEFTVYIRSVETGTSVPHISKRQIAEYAFPCPPINEQRRISEILSAIDDKIELNRRMNRTLESMASALFKSWFVDFDPVIAKAAGRKPFGMNDAIAGLFPSAFEESPLGPIPKGWEISTIGKEARVVGGSTPRTNTPEFWNNGEYYWVTPRDLSKVSDPVVIDSERKITKAGLEQISSRLLSVGTVLLSSRAPIGYLAIADVPLAVNQGFIAIECDGRLPNQYVFNWCRENMDEIVSRAGGTTFAEISKQNFRPIPVAIPPGDLLSDFQEAAKAWHEQVVTNVRETRALHATRDTLLPELLSGELRLDTAEKGIAELL